MLTNFVSIGSYSPEVRTFGTLITSTKVFSLIIPLPRDFRLCIQRFDDPLPRNCRLRTSTSKRMLTKFVSIGSYSPELRSFGTLITSTKVFSLIIICKSL